MAERYVGYKVCCGFLKQSERQHDKGSSAVADEVKVCDDYESQTDLNYVCFMSKSYHLKIWEMCLFSSCKDLQTATLVD